jgi:hypothetical protein
VGLNGLEPTTSPLSGVRSNHLSYRPILTECHINIPFTEEVVNNIKAISTAKKGSDYMLKFTRYLPL